MIISREVNNVKFVFSKSECGYQEVIDDFENSDYVLVVTFNISENGDYLINKLKNVRPNTEVKIFSNIPQRFKQYYHENARNLAKRKIRIYIDKLNPENFNLNTDTSFSFTNHSKIILTNNKVYVGSANFSDESRNNIESGFISDDEEFIKFIKKDIVGYMEGNSISYYNNKFSRLKVMLSLIYSNLENVRQDLYYATHGSHDHAGKSQEFFMVDNNISRYDIYPVDNLLYDLEDLLNEVQIELEEYEIDEFNIGQMISDLENIRDHYTEGSLIDEYMKFDEVRYVNDYIDENSMMAFDEYLEGYHDTGTERASEIKLELAESASEDVLSLLENLKNLSLNLEEIISQFPSSNVNNNITNV
ncbi:hypothetical protein [Clostridium sp.]|uniref:hypothetical protein n=1 Tax=Clostridium sp. TaxID=1506 RepID=UPI002601CBF8|nr:hypothetical protein [Clostridium sp.]